MQHGRGLGVAATRLAFAVALSARNAPYPSSAAGGTWLAHGRHASQRTSRASQSVGRRAARKASVMAGHLVLSMTVVKTP